MFNCLRDQSRRFSIPLFVSAIMFLVAPKTSFAQEKQANPAEITLNQKADGYRGIWYMNQPSNDEYVYKYSGGLGTYCAKHRPFAIYSQTVDKTFFCYGGTTVDSNRKLLHMVSYFDHKTKSVPRPTILMNKKTNDAHDNPVISMDGQGYIWIFSTSHGRSRPSFIHRSKEPYSIDEFELVPATHLDKGQPKRIDNFSYMQVWHSQPSGFQAFFTRYGFPAARTICYMNSKDGKNWSDWRKLAAIEQGHYQVSANGKTKAGSMFNYHPKAKGLNWRTNLYYVETSDRGKSWTSVDGHDLKLPLTSVSNRALVHNYESEGLNVYLKDLQFDNYDQPVLLYISSKGYQSGPKNDPRTWTMARWNGKQWLRSAIATSDNNYDAGELWMVDENDWRLIAPIEKGPQAFNPGGEIAMWVSNDQGSTWKKQRQLTNQSPRNHTYVRRVLNAHPDFVAIWADGHGRKPSESTLYYSNADGDVFQLPREMKSGMAVPVQVK